MEEENEGKQRGKWEKRLGNNRETGQKNKKTGVILKGDICYSPKNRRKSLATKATNGQD